MVDDWDDLDDDDAIEINLRDPAEVAARLLALVAIARRGFLEQRPDLVVDDGADAERFDLRSWLAEEKLLGSLWPEELEVLDTPIGELTSEDIAWATWCVEGAVALAWALQLVPTIPPYDQATDATTVLDAIPAPWSRTTEFRTAAKLRDEEPIARERELAELWYDRADTYWWLFEVADDTEGVLTDLRESILETAAEAFAAGLIARPMAGDFPTRLGAYRDLLPDTVETYEAIAFHRAVALNWLCGITDDEPFLLEP